MSDTMGRTLYAILGVKPLATIGEIRSAYYDKARTEHPDAGGSLDSFMLTVNAYSVLSDATKRKAYDALLDLTLVRCKKCDGAGSRYSARSNLAKDCPQCEGHGFTTKPKKGK